MNETVNRQPFTSRVPTGMNKAAEEYAIQVRNATVEVLQKNPGMDMSVVDAYLNGYEKSVLRADKEITQLREETEAKGGKLDPKWVAAQHKELINQYDEHFRENVLSKRSEADKQAWQKVTERLRPVSLPDLAVRQFHNKDKGGVQWAGLVGGLIAGVMTFKRAGGFSPIGMISTAIAVVAGGWFANMSTGAIGGFVNKYILKKDPNKAQENTQQLQQQQQAAIEQEPKQKRPEGAEPGEYVDPKERFGPLVGENRLEGVADPVDLQTGQDVTPGTATVAQKHNQLENKENSSPSV